MPFDIFQGDRGTASLLLLGGVAGLLVSALFASRSASQQRPGRPGAIALRHWLPILAAAFVASLLHHTEIAAAIAFGTSVVLLSAAVGFVLIVAPVDDVPAEASRIWPILPVPVLLAFVVGFNGTVGWFEALVLATQGGVLLILWNMDDTPRRALPVTSPAEPAQPPTAPSWLSVGKTGELLAAIAVALVAAWAMTRGAERLYEQDHRYPTSVIASTLIGAALAMPMAYTGGALASAGRPWEALTANIGVVFLNLGALLPLIIIIPTAMALPHSIAAATAPVNWTPVMYPRIPWRIDAVALLILSLLFVPASDRKLKLDRQIGGWLIAGYGIYLFAVALMAARE